jgi:RND family efflux transporter MFP subunit
MRNLLIIVLGLSTLAVLTWYYFIHKKQDSSSTAQNVRIPVEVLTVSGGSIAQTLNYNGDINAEYEVKVFSKIPDRIEKYFIDEGDFIKKDAPIARVIATTIEQGVRQAEAVLVSTKVQEANLRVEFERAQRLYNENAMSKQQFDGVKTQYESVKAQVEQTEAALASIKSQLDDATITAPISGVISKRYYDAGDMANPALPVVTIVKMDSVKITFNATEEDLGKLAVAQNATIIVKAYPEKTFDGKISKISPILDPTTRMVEVEVLVDNQKNLLKPGMYAQIEVTTGIISNVIVIPRYATIESSTIEKINNQDQVVKNYYVFIVDSNKAIQRKLNVIYANYQSLAVASGVKAGDKLVVTGQNNLRDGAIVSIVKEED